MFHPLINSIVTYLDIDVNGFLENSSGFVFRDFSDNTNLCMMTDSSNSQILRCF